MSQPLVAAVLFLAGTISALGQSDQQRHEGEEHPATKEYAIGIKLGADQLAGRAVFYVVDPGADEVVK